jgi:septation ring formation regulator EzrA
MKINLFTEFYKETWFIVIIAAICAVLFALIVILFAVIYYRQSCKRKVKDLENRYDEINKSFTTDCSNMINRIEIIAKHNENFDSVFRSANNDFSRILQENDKVCYKSLASLKRSIGEKKYKEANSLINPTKISMDTYAKEASELNDRLQNILKKEEDLRNQMVSLKEKFRKLKQSYNDNLQALEPISASFNYLFDQLTSMFVSFDDDLNLADYNKASSRLPQIEKIIDASYKVMSELPYLSSLAFTVIPENIKELEDTYNELENEGYPLHNLNANLAIKNMNEKLDLCKNKLKTLSINGVSQCLDEIKKNITEFLKRFDDEKKAKVEFEESNKFINRESYSIQQKYAYLSNNINEYKKCYVISKTYLTQIASIKTNIDAMDNLKRTLDGFVNSATKQPYSVLMATVKQIKGHIEKIDNEFDSFHDYLMSLKQNVETAYLFIRQAFENLKEMEYKVRTAGVNTFSELYNNSYNEALKYLYDLNGLLTNRPIDVNNLISVYNDANDKINSMLSEYEEKLQTLNEAENAIVYDNRFRDVSIRCENELKQVEKCFNEADFSRAKMVALNIYKSETQEG